VATHELGPVRVTLMDRPNVDKNLPSRDEPYIGFKIPRYNKSMTAVSYIVNSADGTERITITKWQYGATK